MKRALVITLFAAACGSSKPAPTPAPAAAGGDHHDMAMSPELQKFHDALAPRWHAEPGAPRTQSTCDAVPELLVDADAVAKAPTPAGADDGAWKAQTAALIDALGGLKTACGGGDAAAFDPAFANVHENFHHLMEAGGGEMHGDMKHGGAM